MRKNMIRRVALSALAITMSVSMLTGCNKKKDNSSATKVVEYDVMDYVTTLGVYTGLTETEEITNVTDDDVQAELDSLVSQHTTTTEVTDRPAQTGDTVKIEYTRTPDGAEGETKSDYSVTLGSGDLSEAVENNIMAMNIGETKTFALKENEDTTDETTGETTSSEVNVTYTVTLNSISQKVVPEVNDEFISTNTEYATLEEYKKATKESLQKTEEESAVTTTKTNLLKQVIDDSTVVGTPAYIYNLNYNSICQNYGMYASYFGTDLEGYLKQAGMTMDDIKNSAVESTIQVLVTEAILKDAKKEVTDDDYQAQVDKITEQQGITEEKLLESYSKEDLMLTTTVQKALDYLYDTNKDGITVTHVDPADVSSETVATE